MYANYSGCRTVSNQRERDYNVRSRSHGKHRVREGGRAADDDGETGWRNPERRSRTESVSGASQVVTSAVYRPQDRYSLWLDPESTPASPSVPGTGQPGWVPVIRVFTMAQPLMRFISLAVSPFLLLLLFRLLWFLSSDVYARTHAAPLRTYYIHVYIYIFLPIYIYIYPVFYLSPLPAGI